jgi:hypothetical protein
MKKLNTLLKFSLTGAGGAALVSAGLPSGPTRLRQLCVGHHQRQKRREIRDATIAVFRENGYQVFGSSQGLTFEKEGSKANSIA